MFFLASSMPFLMAIGHLLGLAHADAHVARAVSDDDQRRQREATAALDDLRDAIDVDDLLLELRDRVLPCAPYRLLPRTSVRRCAHRRPEPSRDRDTGGHRGRRRPR